MQGKKVSKWRRGEDSGCPWRKNEGQEIGKDEEDPQAVDDDKIVPQQVSVNGGYQNKREMDSYPWNKMNKTGQETNMNTTSKAGARVKSMTRKLDSCAINMSEEEKIIQKEHDTGSMLSTT